MPAMTNPLPQPAEPVPHHPHCQKDLFSFSLVQIKFLKLSLWSVKGRGFSPAINFGSVSGFSSWGSVLQGRPASLFLMS